MTPPASPPLRGAVLEAICHRCGARKIGPLVPCKSCGAIPQGAERPVAWLFSRHHLLPEELEEAALRIRAGEVPDPSRALRKAARVAMGARPLEGEESTAFSTSQLLAIALGDLFLTPLVGLALWFGLRNDRPTAAAQALRLTLPISAGLVIVWISALLGGLVP